MGDDPSLAVEQSNPKDYIFRKGFWPHPDLQAEVPKRSVERLLSVLQHAGATKNAHNAALREFISRNVVAHVLIFRWYQRAVKEVSGFWTPYSTRASLLDSMPPKSARDLDLQINATLSRSIVSNLLANNRVQNQKEFLEELKMQAASSKHQPLRRKLAELAITNDQKERTKLLKAMEQAEKGGLLQMARKFIFPMHRSLSLVYSRRLDNSRDYLTRLVQVFPQLTGQPATATIVSVHTEKDSSSRLLSARVTYHTKPSADNVKDFIKQFPEKLHDGVITMLNRIEFFDEEELAAIFKDFAYHNAELFDNAVFAPFTEGSGSDSIIRYIVQKTFDVDVHPTLGRAIAARKNPRTRIILLDDCILSGKQAGRIFMEYLGYSLPSGDIIPLNSKEKEKLSEADILYLTALSTANGPKTILKTRARGRELRSYLPRLTARGAAQLRWTKLFAPSSTVFPRSIKKEAEQFFRDVGCSILESRSRDWFNDANMTQPRRDTLRSQRRKKFAVGYGDDQALVVFRYNVPKATVTLLWEKRGQFKGKPWNPLFPIHELEKAAF